MKPTILPIFVSVALLSLLGAGCASSPVKHAENMMTQAGFKAVPITTAAQQQEVSKLPPDRISAVKRNGQVYFVFPDPNHKVIYVGNKSQLHAYKQEVSDLRLKQDAEMEADVAHAAEINEDIDYQSGALPSMETMYEFWPY
jgi:hypothetical protein